jgi:hypothetical protein
MTMKQIWLSRWFGKVYQGQGNLQGKGGLRDPSQNKDAHWLLLPIVLSLAIPIAFTIQCEREEEVGGQAPTHSFPLSFPDIYVKLTVALFFEIKAFKKHLGMGM